MITQTQRANTDVVVVGAGPVGLLTAYLAAQNDVNVVVLEKRESYSRDHSVLLQKSSFDAAATDLKLTALVKKWFGEKSQAAIPILQIEGDLSHILPKNVQILRGVEFVLEENSEKTLQIKGLAELSKIFTKAQVIVGADGANSLVQQEITKIKKQEAHLQHTLLVKLLTKRKPSEQNFISRTLTMAKCGRAFHEHVGKKNEEGFYPVTAQMVIDTDEYLTVEHAKFKNPLSLQDPIHPKLKQSVSLWLQERIKKPESVKIIPIPLRTFIAPKLISKKIGQPVVALVGDAAGYMPYNMAVNIGMEGALQFGIAMGSHFQKVSPYLRSVKSIPKPFKEYESTLRDLLEDAIQEAEFQAVQYEIADSSFISSGLLMNYSGIDVGGRTQTSLDVAGKIGRFATVVLKGLWSYLPF